MSLYMIPEINMEAFESKIKRIEKKCKKHGNDFLYEVEDKIYETVIEEGSEYTVAYYRVNIEGLAKVNGWKFVATIEHTPVGNVVRRFDQSVEIPQKYFKAECICEHCNTRRARNFTFLIYNEEQDVFKQVGRSCLQEYTNGLNAESVAAYESFIKELEDTDEYVAFSGYNSFKKYYNVVETVRIAYECYRVFGYVPVSEYKSTRERVVEYSKYIHNRLNSDLAEQVKNEWRLYDFNLEDDELDTLTESAILHCKNQTEDDSEFMNNLKVIAENEYVSSADIGLLCCIPMTYERYLERKEENSKLGKFRNAVSSEYVGSLKDKVEIDIEASRYVTSFNNLYGTTFLYQFLNTDGNIFIWYSSNPVQNLDKVSKLKGTVKEHSEYNGIKQTVLTRCKVLEYRKEEE